MHANSVALQKLHILLQRLDDARQLLEHGPRRIAAGEKKVAAAETDVEEKKLAVRDVRKASDEANLQVRTLEAKIAELNGKQNEAKSNTEYDIFKGQIATAEAKKESEEDRTLALLEDIDAAESALKEAEEAVIAAKKKVDTIRSEVEAKRPELDATVAEVEAALADAESCIPAGNQRLQYDRLRTAHGAGALAPVEGNFCSACHNKLIAQDKVRMNLGEIISCRSCNRFVYVVEEGGDS